ncbi:synapsin-1 isoform X2 [Myotis myotis]|uniref:synapsin-1 isoform X2 n=1 Tax=Myotis myotis TaxID=51298 RepID=UPI0017496D3C|nr:synapsin-1 isoform X2 [Myotis myotis]
MARAVRSPAGASPRGRRARRSPRRPGALLGPRPEASGPGRPSSAPRRCPREPGRLELPGRPAAGASLAGRPAPLTRSRPLSGPRSRGQGGKGLRRRAGGRERGLRHPSRSVTAAATTTRAEVPLPTCREDTEHARGDHIRVISGFGPFPPQLSFLPAAPASRPQCREGALRRRPRRRRASPPAARRTLRSGPGPAGRRSPSEVGEKGRLEGAIAGEIGISSQKGNTSVGVPPRPIRKL